MIAVTLRMADLAGRFKTNRWQGVAAMVMGFGLHLQANLPGAEAYFGRARQVLAEHPLDNAFCDYLEGFLRITQGRLADAWANCTSASATFRRYGDQWKRLSSASTAAMIAWYRGDLEGIYQMVAHMREITEHTHSEQHTHWVLLWEVTARHLADRSLGKGDTLSLCESAEALVRLKDPMSGILLLARSAELATAQGDLSQALRSINRGLELIEQFQQQTSWLLHLHLYRLETLLDLARATPDAATAAEHVKDAQRDLEAIDTWSRPFPLLAPLPLDASASVALYEGRVSEALELLAQARDGWLDAGFMSRAWELEARRVLVLRHMGDASWSDAAQALMQTCYSRGWPRLAAELTGILHGGDPSPEPGDATGESWTSTTRRTPSPRLRTSPGLTMNFEQVSRAELSFRPTASPRSNTHATAPTLTQHPLGDLMRHRSNDPAHAEPIGGLQPDAEVKATPRDALTATQSTPEASLLRRVVEAVGAARGVLYEVTDGGDAQDPIAVVGMPPSELFQVAMAPARRLVRHAARNDTYLLTSNFNHSEGASSVALDTLRSIIVYPLPGGAPDVARVLYLDRPLRDTPFGPDALAVVQRQLT